MKISEIFLQQPKTFSFEFFPPKDEISAVEFGMNLGQLIRLSPSFVTVTYGAGGSTQERTFTLVNYISNKLGLTCMAHYTCVNATQQKVNADLQGLKEMGVENLMLLRGDPPKGQTRFEATNGGFAYASELIEYANHHFDFCTAGACYIEKHPEAPSLDHDIQNLKYKVNAGAHFLITQLFFDNRAYDEFLVKARQSGVSCRIIPGIIPLTDYKQIEPFTRMSGAEIPSTLKEELIRYQGDREKAYQAGIDYTIRQCRELLASGAPGIHFYTLNKSRATVEIYEELLKGL